MKDPERSYNFPEGTEWSPCFFLLKIVMCNFDKPFNHSRPEEKNYIYHVKERRTKYLCIYYADFKYFFFGFTFKTEFKLF